MYFAACERLAEERPELRNTIEAIDGLLHKNQGLEITLEFLTDFLTASKRELTFVFESLQESDDFSARVVGFCAEHDQPLSASGECDLCDDAEEVNVVQKQVIRVPTLQPTGSGENINRPPPRVLISYSHDSPAHSQTVLDLANELRRHGVDCRIDREDSDPDEGWTLWMKNNLREANFVLCVCTETYKRRFDGLEEPGVGRGVQWEARFTRNYLYNNPNENKKFRAILLGSESEQSIPDELRDYTSYRIEKASMECSQFEQLFRLLTDQQETLVDPLGSLTKISVVSEPWDSIAAKRQTGPLDESETPESADRSD